MPGSTGKRRPGQRIFKSVDTVYGQRKTVGQQRRRVAKVLDNTPHILIDDRAGSKELVRYTSCDKSGELCRLQSGDAAFIGNGPNGMITVGIEVKSISDLISSIATGRLQATQLPRMFETYEDVWLLVYGDYRPAPMSGALQIARTGIAHGGWKSQLSGEREVPYGWLESMLTTMTHAGVHIKCVGGASPEGIRRAAYWLGMLARWYAKPWDEHKGFHTFDNSRRVGLVPEVSDAKLMRAKMASALPGIGFERAMAAAAHFPSVATMIAATEKEWAQVPGVGKRLARMAYDAIRILDSYPSR